MKWEGSAEEIQLSVVIVLNDIQDRAGFASVFEAYDRQIALMGIPYEVIVVIATPQDGDELDVSMLKSDHARVHVLHLSATMGEATALAVGIGEARGEQILTLPGRIQIENDSIPEVVSSLGASDMVIVRRWPRADSWLNRVQTKFFHLILRLMLKKFSFHDLGCGVRIFRKRVLEQVHLYGDQQRFFPILAARSGYKVAEIDIPQSKTPSETNLYSVGVYLRRLLDLLTIFFLVKFTQKPLRFFGLTGFVIFMSGAGLTAWLAYERLYRGIPLADRPILLLGLLLIVLGIQFFAFGLIGELIIFLHSKDLKTYSVEKVVN